MMLLPSVPNQGGIPMRKSVFALCPALAGARGLVDKPSNP